MTIGNANQKKVKFLITALDERYQRIKYLSKKYSIKLPSTALTTEEKMDFKSFMSGTMPPYKITSFNASLERVMTDLERTAQNGASEQSVGERKRIENMNLRRLQIGIDSENQANLDMSRLSKNELREYKRNPPNYRVLTDNTVSEELFTPESGPRNKWGGIKDEKKIIP